MRLRRVRAILEANERGAQEVLDTVARHVEKRFGACWTTHGELLKAAKVVIREQDRAGLAKRATLKGELKRVAKKFGLVFGVAGTIGRGDEIAAAADVGPPLAQHVRVGNLRKGEGMKKVRSEAEELARAIVKGEGLRWKGLTKTRRGFLVEQAATRLAARETAGSTDQDVQQLQKLTRGIDPIAAAQAQALLAKLATDSTRSALRTAADSGTAAESFGGLGFRAPK
jgi:hypothetical protein